MKSHLLLLLLLGACSAPKKSAVKPAVRSIVTGAKTLDDVPSGSAIRVRNGSVWIASDDASQLFHCSVKGQLIDSIQLLHLPANAQRIPKLEKPDYEAAVIGDVSNDPHMFAFGSGSLDDRRNSAVIVSLLDPQRQEVVSLTPLYERIRDTADISKASFNIEGAALRGDVFLLFNRGTNHVITMSWKSLLAHLLNGDPVPVFTAHVVALPKVDGLVPGFSGAAFLDDKHILVSASLEATTDWVADGEVLGSYIGVLETSASGDMQLTHFVPLLDKNGRTAKDKLEGIDVIIKRSENSCELIGIVDNDDGTSRLLQILFE